MKSNHSLLFVFFYRDRKKMEVECESTNTETTTTMMNLDERDQIEQQLQAEDREADQLLQAFHDRSDTIRCTTWMMLGTAYIGQICFISKKYSVTWKHLVLLWGSGLVITLVLGPLWHRWHGWRRETVRGSHNNVSRIQWTRKTSSGMAISTSSFL